MHHLLRTHCLLLSLALIGATAPPERFEARGNNPQWTLRIAPDGLRFDRVLNGRKKRDEGRVVEITHSPGRADISAVIVEYAFHPLGIRGRNGAPISNVEEHEVALSIELVEADCTNAKGRNFPTRVTITDAGDRQYRGCGGPLATLGNTRNTGTVTYFPAPFWRVATIAAAHPLALFWAPIDRGDERCAIC